MKPTEFVTAKWYAKKYNKPVSDVIASIESGEYEGKQQNGIWYIKYFDMSPPVKTIYVEETSKWATNTTTILLLVIMVCLLYAESKARKLDEQLNVTISECPPAYWHVWDKSGYRYNTNELSQQVTNNKTIQQYIAIRNQLVKQCNKK